MGTHAVLPVVARMCVSPRDIMQTEGEAERVEYEDDDSDGSLGIVEK